MRKILIISLVCSLSACLSEEPLKQKYTGFEPAEVPDSWEISTPEEANMNRAMLDQAYRLVYDEERFVMARSLLVFRHGKLVSEAYPHRLDDIHQLINIQSCTKSISSLVVGAAIQQGVINDLDEPFYFIFPHLFDQEMAKRNITLRHALTMQAGLAFDNDHQTLTLYRTPDNSAQFVLSQPLNYSPGLVTNYNDGAPHLISKAIEVKTGQTMDRFADQVLFSKLEIEHWKWEKAQDGTAFGAFSLFLKPRDFGKLGQLLLQKGEWNNEQLIDSTYLSLATSSQVSANYNHEPYGYYFWILPAQNAFMAKGHGGQFLLIVPEQDLVVVYTAWPYTHQQLWDTSHELISLIMGSCQ